MLAFADNPGRRVSRRDVALSPYLWIMFVLTLGLLGVAAVGVSFVMPNVDPTHVLVFAIALAATAVLLAATGRPRPGSVKVHVALVIVYTAPAAAMWAFAPQGSAVIGAAVFVGPLIALWLIDRRQIAAHLLAATGILFLPSVLGIVDTQTLIATITIAPAIIGLAICCVVVTERAEAQGEVLLHAIQHDPLTGVGNRRFLEKHLARAVARAAGSGPAFSVLAFDLNGFKALNDHAGHDAGDALLRDVAAALAAARQPGDIVARQGGDEFSMLLLGADSAEAAARGATIRHEVSMVAAAGGSGVSTGLGIATFGTDGLAADQLLDVADARLRTDKQRRRSLPPTTLRLADADRAPGTPAAASTLEITRGLSRTTLTEDPRIWRLNGTMYAIFAAIGVGMIVTTGDRFTTPAFVWVIGLGVLVGLAHLLTAPPPLGTVRNHLVIAMAYVIPAMILVTCQPGGSVGIGASIFIGPLTAVRLTDRRQIAAHLAAASLLALGVVVFGAVDAATTVAVALLLVTIWSLGVGVTGVLEAVDHQTVQLDRLAHQDPLTRAANRRGLAEFLTERVAEARGPLTVVAFDLDGFKAVNDQLGHSAGDKLLKSVAAALGEAAGGGSLVARLGGDEFCVVLPGRSAAEVAAFTGHAAAALDAGGLPISAGTGSATRDAATASIDELLSAADADLITAKAAARAAQPGARTAS